MGIKYIYSILAAIFISAIYVCPAHAEAKTVSVPMTDSHRKISDVPVYLQLEPGFNCSQTELGCCDNNKKISLEASELHIPYEKLLEEFDGEGLKKAGMSLKMRSEFLWNGSRAMLLKIFHPNKKIVMGKWILIVDKGENSWMISGLYDSKHKSRGEAVLRMIKSVCWHPEEETAEEESTPTGSVKTEKSPMHLAGLRQGALVYTKDGMLPTKSQDGALFVISRLKNKNFLTPEKRNSYAKERLSEVEKGRKISIISENEVMIDGLPGIELTAYTEDGEKTLITQTALFDTSDIHLMVGIAQGDTITNMELFHTLAATYRRGI